MAWGGGRLVLPLLWLYFASVPGQPAPGAAIKPNILIVLIDDLGFGDVGWNSPEMAKATQTLSAAANRGVILHQFYTNPSCTPSRAALMTGRYSYQYGLQDSVIHSTEPRGLSLGEVTLAEHLKFLGYHTMGVGKWHLGFVTDDYTPTKRGFDDYYGILTGGGDHYEHTSTDSATIRAHPSQTSDDMHTILISGQNLVHNNVPVDPDSVANIHTTDLYTSRTLDLLKDYSSREQTDPFFIYLSYQAVHSPVQAPSEYYTGDFDTGCARLAASASPHKPDLCGMVAMLDVAYASIEAELKSSGLYNDTLIVFMSDNGGVTRHGSSNLPLRGDKGTYFEGGVRVPAFFGGGYTEHVLSAAGVEPYRQQGLVHMTDIHATLVALAAGAGPSGPPTYPKPRLDGIDVWGALVSGAQKTPRSSILHNINSQHFGYAGGLRVGDYKLIVETKVPEAEIYTYGQTAMLRHMSSVRDFFAVLRQSILEGNTYHLYDVRKNPFELESEAEECAEDVALCTNLFYNPDFAELKENMTAVWDGYKVLADQYYSEWWYSDGPLADPALFGGVWLPWRDTEDFIPFGTFSFTNQHAVDLYQMELERRNGKDLLLNDMYSQSGSGTEPPARRLASGPARDLATGPRLTVLSAERRGDQPSHDSLRAGGAHTLQVLTAGLAGTVLGGVGAAISVLRLTKRHR